MSREMRFQAATVDSHSMILVILVTSSEGRRGGKGVTGANCARDRENKLSPVATTSHPPVRRRGWRDTGCGKVGWDERPVSTFGDEFFHFFSLHHQRCLNTPAREYLVTGEPRSLPFHLTLPGYVRRFLEPASVSPFTHRLSIPRLVVAVLLAALFHVELQLIWGALIVPSCAPQLARVLDDLRLHVIVREILLHYIV